MLWVNTTMNSYTITPSRTHAAVLFRRWAPLRAAQKQRAILRPPRGGGEPAPQNRYKIKAGSRQQKQQQRICKTKQKGHPSYNVITSDRQCRKKHADTQNIARPLGLAVGAPRAPYRRLKGCGTAFIINICIGV